MDGFCESRGLVKVSLSVSVVGCGDEAVAASFTFGACVLNRARVQNLYLVERMKLKVAFLSLCLCICGTLAAAAPQFTVTGSAGYERNRIINLEQSLNFSRVAMTSMWRVTILSGNAFHYYTKRLNIDTESAFTALPFQETYLNEDYLIYANDIRVRQTLAHEAGHLICECSSEAKANEIAYQIQFGK